jgi:hypothetical protein
MSKVEDIFGLLLDVDLYFMGVKRGERDVEDGDVEDGDVEDGDVEDGDVEDGDA